MCVTSDVAHFRNYTFKILTLKLFKMCIEISNMSSFTKINA